MCYIHDSGYIVHTRHFKNLHGIVDVPHDLVFMPNLRKENIELKHVCQKAFVEKGQINIITKLNPFCECV